MLHNQLQILIRDRLDNAPIFVEHLNIAAARMRCSGSIQCSIRFGMILASKNSSPRPRRKRRTNNATRSTQRTFFAELIPSSPFAAHARESFGQIRTLELRNSARIVQSLDPQNTQLTR